MGYHTATMTKPYYITTPSATKHSSDRATHTTTAKEICKRYNLARCGTSVARVSTLVKGAPRRYELQRAHALTHSHLERETDTTACSNLEDECGKDNNKQTYSHLETETTLTSQHPRANKVSIPLDCLQFGRELASHPDKASI